MKNKNKNKLLSQILSDKDLRVALAKQSHEWFFAIYFNHYIKYKSAPFHKEMFRASEDESIKNLIMLSFRGSAKSTIMTLSYPIWAIMGKQQKKFVIIIGQTQRQARYFLSNIKRELESNELLRSDFGPFEEQDDEWGSYSLVLPWYNARIAAVSMEQTIRSLRHKEHRPDLILCDDIENLDSVRNRENRDKIYNWITGEIIPAGDFNTRAIFTGNLLHEDSLLMRMIERIKNKELDGVFKKIPLIDEQNVIAWPGKFKTMEEIEREKKKIGNEIAWQREYLLRIVPDGGQIVHRKWIQYYDKLPETRNNENFRFTLTGIDLAISPKGDFTAMVSANVYGEDRENLKIYILPNPINKRMEFSETIKVAMELSTTLGNGERTKLSIENISYQDAAVQELKRLNFPAEGFNVHGKSKDARLAVASHTIRNGTVLFPRDGCRLLIDQLINFRTAKYDDLADAFVIAVLSATREEEPLEANLWVV